MVNCHEQRSLYGFDLSNYILCDNTKWDESEDVVSDFKHHKWTVFMALHVSIWLGACIKINEMSWTAISLYVLWSHNNAFASRRKYVIDDKDCHKTNFFPLNFLLFYSHSYRLWIIQFQHELCLHSGAIPCIHALIYIIQI